MSVSWAKQPFGLIAVYKFLYNPSKLTYGNMPQTHVTRTQNEPENGPDNGLTFHMHMHQILSTWSCLQVYFSTAGPQSSIGNQRVCRMVQANVCRTIDVPELRKELIVRLDVRPHSPLHPWWQTCGTYHWSHYTWRSGLHAQIQSLQQ